MAMRELAPCWPCEETEDTDENTVNQDLTKPWNVTDSLIEWILQESRRRKRINAGKMVVHLFTFDVDASVDA